MINLTISNDAITALYVLFMYIGVAAGAYLLVDGMKWLLTRYYPESLTKLWHDTEADLRSEIKRRDDILGQLMNERIDKHESGSGPSAHGSLSAELRHVWAEYGMRVDGAKDTTQ